MNPLLQLGLVVAAYFVGKAAVTMMRRPKAGGGDAAAAMAGLRQMALSRTASDVADAPLAGVFGVLMELGVGGGVATIVGLVDGNASLYLSTGGGVLGGVGHESVQRSARKLCEVAAATQEHLTPATEFPMPGKGRVRFYITAEGGVRSAESEESSVQKSEHPLHSLYVAGQDLLTELRLSTQRPQPSGA